MIIIRFALYTALLWLITWLVPDISVASLWPALVITGGVMTIIQEILKPILKIITVPLSVLTLGLFAIVLNAAIFWFVGQWLAGFSVGSYVAAFIGSVLFSLGAWLVRRATK